MKKRVNTILFFFFLGWTNLLLAQDYDIIWTNLVNVSVDGNTITAISANGRAASENSLESGTDGLVEITGLPTNQIVVLGLSQTNPPWWNSSNYALYFNNSYLSIYENGSSLGSFGTYTNTDVFQIKRIGTTITYKKNDVIFHTSSTSSSTSLLANIYLGANGVSISDVKASFPAPSQGTGGGGGGNPPDTSSVTHSFFVPDDNEDDVNIRYSSGKVVIGEDSLQKPGDFRLLVQDGILTEEVVIAIKNSSQWADDVFGKDYPLRSINEVDAFVKENKHLPGIPSAREVVVKGINVGEMDAKLLRQIEELWLHLIAQEERIHKLEEENISLKKRETPPKPKE